MVEIGVRLLVVPDMLLNTSSDEKIPDNNKSDTDNKDQVVVIMYSVGNRHNPDQTYEGHNSFFLEDIWDISRFFSSLHLFLSG